MNVEAFIKRKSRKFKDEIVKKPAALKTIVHQKLGLNIKFLNINKALFSISGNKTK